MNAPSTTWAVPRAGVGGRGRRFVATALAALLGAALAGAVAAQQPGMYRHFLAAALLLVFLTAAASWPNTTAVAALGYLSFMAVGRRMLIDSSGWTNVDPLLLVGPLVVAALLARNYVVAQRRPDSDPLVTAVLALLALMVLQIFNPSGPGLAAGFAGLLFLAVPLLWFLAGRDVADRGAVKMVGYGVIPIGMTAALYGLVQTQVGFPSWDKAWIAHANIASLNIGQGQLRAFGMLSNSAEYKQILVMATVAIFALIAHRRPAAILALPLLLTALVLSGARSGLVLALLGLILVAAVRMRRAWAGFALGITASIAAVVILGALSSTLAGVAGGSSNAAIARQASGFASPLNSQQSTLPGHVTLFVNGLVSGVTHPLGSGTGAGGLASTRFAADAGPGSSEVDISDLFITLGVVGGLLYLFVVVVTLRRVVANYRATGDELLLIVFGLMVVSFGGWLKGAHYAAAAILWFCVGWATRRDLAVGSRRR